MDYHWGVTVEAVQRVRGAFEEALADFLSSAPVRRVLDGQITEAHYKSYLREVYFHTRDEPQLQAFVTAWFKGEDRALVRPFLKDAISEVGHDQFALNDLTRLGGIVDTITTEFPLPTTVSLTSFAYWATQFLNPVSYLGYQYFLEAVPTVSGAPIMQALRTAGVPDEAMTFISNDRFEADVKLLDKYIETLVRTERDVIDITYVLKTTAKLYEVMVSGAFEAVDKPFARLTNMGETE